MQHLAPSCWIWQQWYWHAIG